jgi:hypothetical protein
MPDRSPNLRQKGKPRLLKGGVKFVQHEFWKSFLKTFGSGCGGCGFRLGCNGVEGFGFVHRQIGQNFAVHFDASFC